jgi:HAD superfamily phosphatase (TIGR01681 family)
MSKKITCIIFDLDETLVCSTNGLMDNVTDILKNLKHQGFTLGLASYNTCAPSVLEEYDLQKYFEYIEYEDWRYHGIDMKERMLNSILARSNIPSENCLFVDDQKRFLKTARKLGMSICQVNKIHAPVHEVLQKHVALY